MPAPKTLDLNDAPPGFVPVLKSAVTTARLGNICRACDWRPECDASKFRCMSYARADGCGVVFQRKARRKAAGPRGKG